ncbi:MAG: hypothetical protein ACRD2D_02255, partial [Terriglobales bacterium]
FRRSDTPILAMGAEVLSEASFLVTRVFRRSDSLADWRPGAEVTVLVQGGFVLDIQGRCVSDPGPARRIQIGRSYIVIGKTRKADGAVMARSADTWLELEGDGSVQTADRRKLGTQLDMLHLIESVLVGSQK